MAGIIWVQEVLRDLADRALQVRSAYCIRLGLGQFSCPVRRFRRWTGSKASADLSRLDGRIVSVTVTQADDGADIAHGAMPFQLQQTVVERVTALRPPFDAGFGYTYPFNVALFWNLSPVEIQVIDPLGRRIGVDFITGDILQEIPTAHFWRSPEADEPDFIFIPDPITGTYTLRLLGIASGAYHVGLDWITPEGALTVQAFTGESLPGQVYEYSLTFDPQTLPTLPLTLTWLSPLREGEVLSVSRNQRLAVRFRLADADAQFVADEGVVVWLLDPEQPTQPVAVFTTSGPPDERVHTLRRAQMYLVTVPLRRYNLEPGKVYLLGVHTFGAQRGTIALRVQP